MATSAWLNPAGRPMTILKGLVIGAVGLWLIVLSLKPADEEHLRRIGDQEAARIVENRFPGSHVREVEVNRERGLLVYEVEMADGRKKEVEINTLTGQIVKIEDQ